LLSFYSFVCTISSLFINNLSHLPRNYLNTTKEMIHLGDVWCSLSRTRLSSYLRFVNDKALCSVKQYYLDTCRRSRIGYVSIALRILKIAFHSLVKREFTTEDSARRKEMVVKGTGPQLEKQIGCIKFTIFCLNAIIWVGARSRRDNCVVLWNFKLWNMIYFKNRLKLIRLTKKEFFTPNSNQHSGSKIINYVCSLVLCL